MVKIPHQSLHVLPILPPTALLYLLLGPLQPLVIQSLGAASRELIGHHAVLHIHQRIAVNSSLDDIHQHFPGQLEVVSLIRQSHAGKDRHLGETGIFQRLPQNPQIVGCTAGTAGLEEYDAGVLRVA